MGWYSQFFCGPVTPRVLIGEVYKFEGEKFDFLCEALPFSLFHPDS